MRLVFDRGTILVADPAEGLNPEDLPGVRWDPRVRVHRAPARFYEPIVRHLTDRGVRYRDGVRTPDEIPPGGWSAIALRPYQEAAISAWELAGRRGVVVLPTGSGKTQVALAMLGRTRLRALCLVPTRVLLDQWRLTIERMCHGSVGIYGDGTRDLAPVTVATFESAWRHMHHLGNRFDLLVIDEAHHFGCGMRDDALEMAIAAARLGLTATPPRGEPARRLAELVGPVIFELSIGDLAGSFLAGFDVISLRLELSQGERAFYEEAMAPYRAALGVFRDLAPSGSWEDFARWAARTPEGRRALSGWRRARGMLSLTQAKRIALGQILARHRGARVLVFTADNETAYTIARQHLVMPITCDIGRAERDEALGLFRSGELLALVSARVLNEGLDVPEADVGIIVGGAQGEREHVQRVGRLLRPREGKRALVYELVARATLEMGQARRRGEGLASRTAASV